jgi:50S ribosomal protein L16 3-hydroxylase
MDIDKPLRLLGDLTPTQFMRRHWQKKPLVVRQAINASQPVISRAALFRLAARADVESRLITQQLRPAKSAGEASPPSLSGQWAMQSGPFAARSLPALSTPAWTLLVQGVDLHDAHVHDLMQQFRFIPDARLDDVMISFATPMGGVGPHFDSYDVFLLQTSGRRRWRISRQKDLTLQEGVPLKILQNFQADEEFVLDAGDMLYLPPRYAHEGVAEALNDDATPSSDCITCSIGFRAPAKAELAAELLHRMADFDLQDDDEAQVVGQSSLALYKDPDQSATTTPAELPAKLQDFAHQAVLEVLKNPLAMVCVLGEYLTEPKPSVWFEESEQSTAWTAGTWLQLDPRTRMMYDAHHVFINGESHRARGADAKLMRRLADERALMPKDLKRASSDAVSLLTDWATAGWIRVLRP